MPSRVACRSHVAVLCFFAAAAIFCLPTVVHGQRVSVTPTPTLAEDQAALDASLTPAQLTQLKTLFLEFQPRIHAATKAARVKATAKQGIADLQAHIADHRARYREILTETQRAQFDRLVRPLQNRASKTPSGGTR